MACLSQAEFNAIIAKTKARKNKRVVKRRQLKAQGFSILINRGELKKEIVRLLGLLDRKKNGPLCRIGIFCPRFRREGEHDGEVGYHLIPQKRGDAARMLRENVVYACSDANYGEKENRDLYRQYHVEIFGEERIKRIEAISRTTADYSNADLMEIKKGILKELYDAVED